MSRFGGDVRVAEPYHFTIPVVQMKETIKENKSILSPLSLSLIQLLFKVLRQKHPVPVALLYCEKCNKISKIILYHASFTFCFGLKLYCSIHTRSFYELL